MDCSFTDYCQRSTSTPLVDEQVPALLKFTILGRVLLPSPLLIKSVISGCSSTGSSTAVTWLASQLKTHWLLLVSWESAAFIV